MVCTILLCIQKDNFVHPWGPYVWVNVYLKKHSCIALEMCIVKFSKYTTASGLFDQFVITKSIVLFPKHATKRKNLICNRHILNVRSTGYSVPFRISFYLFACSVISTRTITSWGGWVIITIDCNNNAWGNKLILLVNTVV